MGSSKLTDEELIELANKTQTGETTEDTSDLIVYILEMNIQQGNFEFPVSILYYHYKLWSKAPIDFTSFHAILKTKYNYNFTHILIAKDCLAFNYELLVGDYVKFQKRKKEETRLRKISSLKSKTKRKD